MKFIKTIFKKLSSFQKLKANSYKLKAILSIFRNLQPKTYNLKPSFGFTLIETLVAISILMVAVASPLTITQKGLASAIYAKDQIIASYLAQDAIEYLKNSIDLNVNAKRPWLEGISGSNNCGTACVVNTRLSAGAITACGGTCNPLNYNKLSYIYNQETDSNNKVSPFTRSVTVTEIAGGVEALIKVNMSWMDKNTPRSIDFYTRIYNWR